ncbi:MAG: hypothetical protein NZ522_00700 [Chitinophagales bacterium]|nr:hypothetical protein [Chitinophagales bacterium]
MCNHFSRFVAEAWKNRNYSIYIFDLDNTLGHTYPTLINRTADEIKRLRCIVPHTRMCGLAANIASSKSRKVFVLTARAYNTQQVTAWWIKERALINIPPRHIFLVLSPMQKIWLLKIAALFCKRITYIDDLSYNHEHGEVKFYNDCIAALPKKIRYIGYKTIKQFNERAF